MSSNATNFLVFSPNCSALASNLPLLPLVIVAVVTLLVVPYCCFKLHERKNEKKLLVSVSRSWRGLASLLSVLAFVLVNLIVYIIVCSANPWFKAVGVIFDFFLVVVVLVNPDETDDAKDPNFKLKQKIHMAAAWVVFSFLTVISILIGVYFWSANTDGMRAVYVIAMVLLGVSYFGLSIFAMVLVSRSSKDYERLKNEEDEWEWGSAESAAEITLAIATFFSMLMVNQVPVLY